MEHITPDDINIINKESWQYTVWEREQKNKILAMSDSQKKQERWNKLFTPFINNDSYLSGKVF